jgi:hypothetical protein
MGSRNNLSKYGLERASKNFLSTWGYIDAILPKGTKASPLYAVSHRADGYGIYFVTPNNYPTNYVSSTLPSIEDAFKIINELWDGNAHEYRSPLED